MRKRVLAYSSSVGQQSPTFWAPGTDFVQDSFSTHWCWGWETGGIVQVVPWVVTMDREEGEVGDSCCRPPGFVALYLPS